MKERESRKRLVLRSVVVASALLTPLALNAREQQAVLGEHCRITESAGSDVYKTDIYFHRGISGYGEMLKVEVRKLGDPRKQHTLAGFGRIYEWTRQSPLVVETPLQKEYRTYGGLNNYMKEVKSMYAADNAATCEIKPIDIGKFIPPQPKARTVVYGI